MSRFGNETKFRVESAKMIATWQLSLRGTPYIYQGQELGMVNARFPSINDYRDIETKIFYEQEMKKGEMTKEEIMEAIHRKGRDNTR